jgi:hypothetical protein
MPSRSYSHNALTVMYVFAETNLKDYQSILKVILANWKTSGLTSMHKYIGK